MTVAEKKPLMNHGTVLTVLPRFSSPSLLSEVETVTVKEQATSSHLSSPYPVSNHRSTSLRWFGFEEYAGKETARWSLLLEVLGMTVIYE